MDLQSPRPATTVRRNPPRRAKQTPSAADPLKAAADPHAAPIATIKPFPLNEILESDPAPPRAPKPDAANNLKVFLRIRPLEIRARAVKQPVGGGGGVRARGKAVPTKIGNGKGGSNNNVCLSVGDSGSVTLSAPNSLTDPKRSKSEVYDGFAHVFDQGSHQKEVYEKVMDPLVTAFMGGKSALLAAMGPTGSGKTHTMFGCPREPGMVPLALHKIFKQETESDVPQPTRSYYLSMFEIYSERGKGEKIFDLLPDGADVYLQQSIVKGLQEVMVSTVIEAECLIARGMLKRTTAATNANSQSSRSQCIINIRNSLESANDGNDISGNGAVLTIADLAGAEREKKTGNQGARLVESNFINNTSMIFGLCLRSLLEHQRNPKKPLQKHFKNSMLTKYLKEYMEGKKQMTLMLTVKPGEDDYLDTSYLLRQASPYMKIKFNNPEEIPNVYCQKRSTAVVIRSELPKRRKYNSPASATVDGATSDKGGVTAHQISERVPISSLNLVGANSGKEQEVQTPESKDAYPISEKVVQMRTQHNEENCLDSRRISRNSQVMQNFAKALWNVLKEYKQKLEASEKEVNSLKQIVEEKSTHIMNLEVELKELHSCCLCHKHSMNESPVSEEDACGFAPPIHSANFIESKNNALAVDYNHTPLSTNIQCNGSRKNNDSKESIEELDCSAKKTSPESSSDSAHVDVSSRSMECCLVATDADHPSNTYGHLLDSPDEKKTDLSRAETCNGKDSNMSVKDVKRQNHQMQSRNQKSNGSNTMDYGTETLKEVDNPGVSEILSDTISTDNADLDALTSSLQSCILPTDAESSIIDRGTSADGKHTCLSLSEISHTVNSSTSINNVEGQSTQFMSPESSPKAIPEDRILEEKYLQMRLTEDEGLTEDKRTFSPQNNEAASTIKNPESNVTLAKAVRDNGKSQVGDVMKEENLDTPLKPMNTKTARRRLMPASSMLLKGFSGLDIENDNPMESKSKRPAEGRERSQGSISLVHLIKSNLNH